MQQIDKDEITGRLFLLKNDLSPMEFRIAKSIALLIQKLPMDSIESTIMEQELITRFVEPALAPLFENTTTGILFR